MLVRLFRMGAFGFLKAKRNLLKRITFGFEKPKARRFGFEKPKAQKYDCQGLRPLPT